MDPLSILTAAVALATTTWDVSQQLKKFIKNTRKSDTVKNLSSEVTQLGRVCDDIKNEAQKWAKARDRLGRISKTELREDTNLVKRIREQLEECDRVMKRLDNTLSSVTRDRSNILTRAFRPVTLNTNKDEIAESRTQIAVLTRHLQISLQLVAMIANQQLLSEMTRIQTMVLELGSTLEPKARKVAQEILNSGKSLYEASVAGRSIIKETESSRRILEWLERVNRLQLEQSTPRRLVTCTGTDTASRVFSMPEDAQTQFTGATYVPGGVMLDHHSQTGVDEKGKAAVTEDYENEIEEEIALDLANTSLSSGKRAFDKGDFDIANADLKEALSLVEKLPMRLRQVFNIQDIRYYLAICAYYVHDANTAEVALLGIVEWSPRNKSEALGICHAGHVLSQIYIKQGKLELARSYSGNAYRGRRKLLGKDRLECYESLGLCSRIHELLGNSQRARTYSNLIPLEARKKVCEPLRALKPGSKKMPNAGLTGGISSRLAPRKTAKAELLAASLSDGKIIIWHVDSAAIVKTIETHYVGSSISPLVFSADGQSIASLCSKCEIKIWSISGTSSKTLVGHTDEVFAIDYSKDGTMLASVSRDKTIRIRDPVQGSLLKRIETDPDLFRILKFAPDGKTLAARFRGNKVALWNTKTGKVVKKLTGHSNLSRCVDFSPDGKLLASGSDDKTIRIWNPLTGASLRTFHCTGTAYRIQFSADGVHLACSCYHRDPSNNLNSYSIQIWDWKSNQLVRSTDDNCQISITFLRDENLLAYISSRSTVKIWNVSTGEVVKILKHRLGSSLGELASW